MITKQTHAILVRLREGANKIFYDIKLANANSQARIAKVQAMVQHVVLGIDIIGNFLVIIFAFLIAFRIFKILEKEKGLQEKVENTNTAMRAIVENIPVGVVLVNSDKKIIQINEPASKILRYDSFDKAKQKLLQSYCFETYCDIHPSSCPILDFGKKNIQFTEKEMISGSGRFSEKVTILKSVIPVFMNDEYLLMEVFVDISERKKQEQALEALVKERTKKLEDAQKELINKAVDSGRAQLSAWCFTI